MEPQINADKRGFSPGFIGVYRRALRSAVSILPIQSIVLQSGKTFNCSRSVLYSASMKSHIGVDLGGTNIRAERFTPDAALRPAGAVNTNARDDLSPNSTKAPLDWLPTIVQRVVPRFDPIRIILFGSHARGVAGPYSDLDLLVVLPHVTDKRKAGVEIRRVLADLTVPSDIIVTTPEEITRRGHLVGDVLRPALREGKVLYERS